MQNTKSDVSQEPAENQSKQDQPFLDDVLALWRPKVEFINHIAETDEPEKPAEKESKPKNDLALGPEQFSKLDEQGAELLKEHKISRISIVGKSDHDLVVIERESDLVFPMDASTGCRKITIANKMAAELVQGKDGSMELRNIRGFSAEVDPGKDPYLGIPLPWVTANVSKVSLTKGDDGKYSVQVTGKAAGVERTTTVALADEQVERLRGVLTNLDKLRTGDDKQLTKKIDETKLLEGVPEQNPRTWGDTALDILMVAAGGAAALKIAQVAGRRLGLIGDKAATNGAPPLEPKNEEPSKPEKPAGQEAVERSPEAEKLDALSAKKDVNGLKEFALATKDTKLAEKAVQAMITHSGENVELLREIARSNTHATGYAMNRLTILSEDPKDTKLVEERWKNGDILNLWKEGKINPRDVLSALEFSGNTESAAKEAMQSLPPELKADLCRGLLQKDFLGSFDISGVSPELRIKAAQHLIDTNDPKIEKILLNLTADRNKELSQFAKKELNRFWTNDASEGRSEFQNRRLKDFVEDLARRPWGNAPDASEQYRKWSKADQKLADAKRELLNEMTEKLGGNIEIDDPIEKFDKNWDNEKVLEQNLKEEPKILEDYRRLRQEERENESLRKQVDQVVRAREAGLRPLIEKYCRDLKIPVPEFELVSELGRDYRGIYKPGRGKVEVLEKSVMSGERPSAEFLNTLFHELTHVEQDALMIKRIADKLKLGTNPTAAERAELKRQYLLETAGKTAPTEKAEVEKSAKQWLSDEWLNKVIEQRNGQPLSEPQSQRAERLLEGKREKAENDLAKSEMETTARRMRQRHARLSSDAVPLFIILGTDAKDREERAKRTLETEKLPESLKDALNKLAEAEKAQKPREEILPLEKAVRQEILDALRMQQIRLERTAHKIYVERAHEVESHDVGRRAGFFAQQAEVGTVSAEPVVKPSAEAAPVEVKPAEVKPAEVKPAEVKPGETGQPPSEGRQRTSGRNRGPADEPVRVEDRGRVESRGDATFVTDKVATPEVQALLEKWKGNDKVLEKDLAKAINKLPPGEKRQQLEEQLKGLTALEEGAPKDAVKRAMAELITEARKPGFKWDSAVGRVVKVAGAAGLCVAVGMLVQVLMENESGYSNFRGTSVSPDLSGK